MFTSLNSKGVIPDPPFLYYKDSIRFYTTQAFHKLSSSFVLMQNKHTISFYHPKACQPETSATRFSPTQRSRTHTHSHTKRVPITFTKNRGVVMSTPPLIYYSYHSYTLRTCIVAGRGILGCFECVVKEDSFGLFGGLGRGSWQERKEGAGRGSWARERGRTREQEVAGGAGGGRGIASPKVGAKGEARGRGGKWRPGEGGRRAA